MTEDRCICCGEIVPEGRMICPNCEAWKKAVSEDNWKRALEYCDNDVLAMKNLSHGETVQIAEGKRKPMPRYIDAEKLTEAVREKCDRCEDTRTDFCSTRWCDIAKVIKMIDNAPTADVVERKKAEWEICGSFDDLLRCSNCRFIMPMIDERFNFCPDCGADMRKEKTDGKIR